MLAIKIQTRHCESFLNLLLRNWLAGVKQDMVQTDETTDTYEKLSRSNHVNPPNGHAIKLLFMEYGVL